MYCPVNPIQWLVIEKYFPNPPKKPWRKAMRKGGRPPLSNLQCFNALLWMIFEDARWRQLPKNFGSAKSVIKRIQKWDDAGTLRHAWRGYLAYAPVHRRKAIAVAMEARKRRRLPFWQFTLDYIYNVEFKGRTYPLPDGEYANKIRAELAIEAGWYPTESPEP